MRKYFGSGAVVLGVSLLVFTFQNCSGGDLPNAAQGETPLSASSTAPLKLTVPQAAMGPNSTMILDVSGGAPPYTFSVLSGPVTIGPDSGTVTSALVAGNASVRVTDSNNQNADGTFIVDLSLASVTAGSLELTSPGSAPQTFTVPMYHTLTIEAWGAGGGAGGITNFAGADGGDGGASSVTGSGWSLSAAGGKKGTRCTVSVLGGSPGAGGAAGTSGNVTNMAGGAATATQIVSGGIVPSKGGNGANGGAGGDPGRNGASPGGGGGSIYYLDGDNNGCNTGSGGGGAYVKSSFTAITQVPPNSTLSLVVGAAGTSGGSNISAKPGIGAAGKIRIVWN